MKLTCRANYIRFKSKSETWRTEGRNTDNYYEPNIMRILQTQEKVVTKPAKQEVELLHIHYERLSTHIFLQLQWTCSNHEYQVNISSTRLSSIAVLEAQKKGRNVSPKA